MIGPDRHLVGDRDIQRDLDLERDIDDSDVFFALIGIMDRELESRPDRVLDLDIDPNTFL